MYVQVCVCGGVSESSVDAVAAKEQNVVFAYGLPAFAAGADGASPFPLAEVALSPGLGTRNRGRACSSTLPTPHTHHDVCST